MANIYFLYEFHNYINTVDKLEGGVVSTPLSVLGILGRDINKDLTTKNQDKDMDLTPKDQDKDKDLIPKDQDKDKDLTPKDQDKDKDLTSWT